MNNADGLKREGVMVLNYEGWREYHRNYRTDYNNVNIVTPVELVNDIRIYNSSGGLLKVVSKTLIKVKEDNILNLAGFAPGIYIVVKDSKSHTLMKF